MGLHWLSRASRGVSACKLCLHLCVYKSIMCHPHLPRNLTLLPSLDFQNKLGMFISLDFPHNGIKMLVCFLNSEILQNSTRVIIVKVFLLARLSKQDII